MTSAGSIASGGRSRGRSSGFTPGMPSSVNPPRTLANASVCAEDPCDDQGNKTGCLSASASAGGSAGAGGLGADATAGSFALAGANENAGEEDGNLAVSTGGLTTPAVANFAKGDELVVKRDGSGLFFAAVLVDTDGLDSLEAEGSLLKVEKPNAAAGAAVAEAVGEGVAAAAVVLVDEDDAINLIACAKLCWACSSRAPLK